MPAATTLSALIALYLARCRIEGLSPRTQRAYSETLARFQRSVAAQGVSDEVAAVETATVIRYCETFQARRPVLRDLSGRRPATRHRYFREVRCFFKRDWGVPGHGRNRGEPDAADRGKQDAKPVRESRRAELV